MRNILPRHSFCSRLLAIMGATLALIMFSGKKSEAAPFGPTQPSPTFFSSNTARAGFIAPDLEIKSWAPGEWRHASPSGYEVRHNQTSWVPISLRLVGFTVVGHRIDNGHLQLVLREEAPAGGLK